MHQQSLTPLAVKPRGHASFLRRAISQVETTLAAPDIPAVSYNPRPIVLVDRTPVVSPEKTRTAVRAAEPKAYKPRKKMALLLPGHNEELIIASTIRTAIAAGQKRRDIFMVDDASDDDTRRIAVEMLGEANVLTVARSGKAMAVGQAIRHFNIERDYKWLHVADADSVFSENYFRIYRRKLTPDYVVAVGFVQSLRGNWISTYRSFSYTYGQHVFRRIQAALGMVSVFPGPVTSFRTDILSKLDINANNVTEDFDMTLQVHRKKLGKIVYIPKAVNYTQDPKNYHDFCKQNIRWYRGFFQGIQEHRIGLHGQRIDVGIGFQLLQTAFFLFQITVLFPIILIQTHHWLAIPIAISVDFILTSILAIASAIVIRRWTLLGMLPFYYFLRVTEIVLYFAAFVEIIILKKMRTTTQGWATEGRRYKLNTAALQDVAK